MFKSIFILILLSILAIFALEYVAMGLNKINLFYSAITSFLEKFLPGKGTISQVRLIIALILIPIIIGLIPAFIFWLFTRREMPYLSEIICAVWVMLVTLIALRRHG